MKRKESPLLIDGEYVNRKLLRSYSYGSSSSI